MTRRGRFEVVTTALGARAMLDHETGEVMHPEVGALCEARALYVEASRLGERLCAPGSDPLLLLDVGLGAGTNAALACAEALRVRAPRALHIVSFDLTLEAFELALAREAEAFGFVGEVQTAARALCARGEYRSAQVHWTLCLGDARACMATLPAQAADIVFWDPFSPRTSDALWSYQAFRLLRAKCREGATVHTYSAATATRSALLLADFFVGKGPRSNEKQRYSTQAATRLHDLASPLDATWLRTLASNTRALPADAPAEALARLAAAPQFVAEMVTSSMEGRA